MNKIMNFCDKMYINAMTKMAARKAEKENGDHLIEVLGTIIIAIVLLVLFRAQVTALFKQILQQTTNRAGELFQNVQ